LKDNEFTEMSETEFNRLLLKMINDCNEDSNKQISEVRKSIQNLNKKVSNMKEKFSKKMEIIKNSRYVRN
jgi:hypothetical protein